MAILSSTDLADGVCFATVDHDPALTATDMPKGSFLQWDNGTTIKLYIKKDDGSTTSVDRIPTEDNP